MEESRTAFAVLAKVFVLNRGDVENAHIKHHVPASKFQEGA